jgi:putative phosphoribosyl transferase
MIVARRVHEQRAVFIETVGIHALLGIPEPATGMVVLAHAGGSGRFRPRNNYIAEDLRRAGFATLLLDLLTVQEESSQAKMFEISFLAARLGNAIEWLENQPSVGDLPLGYFSTGAGAAVVLLAAAQRPHNIAAVVALGGRPGMAGGAALSRVRAPTQLIVGALDATGLALNQDAITHFRCEHEFVIVPNAGDLFAEPGAMDSAIGHATRWFYRHLGGR